MSAGFDPLQVQEMPAVRGPEQWQLRPRLRLRWLLLGALIAMLAALSAQRVELDRFASQSLQALRHLIDPSQPSQVVEGLSRIGRELLPIQLSETTPLQRLPELDHANLPWGSRIEERSQIRHALDPETLQLREQQDVQRVLVEPLGYLWRALGLMLETIEIALWGSLLAVLLGAPLALLGTRGYSPHAGLVALARSLSGLLRSVPDLISALFLVLAFGFGPIAGVLALGLHTAGFLGKFFAEEIENAPVPPQQALRAAGASPLQVLRHAVLPQVLPAYVGQVQYILERNIRTATVIGVVGAGGIGQELKGRFELFDFAHVATLLLVIFASVMLLELFSARLRKRLL